MTQETAYAAIVMTDQGQPVGAVIDWGAFLALQPELTALQALRDAGQAETPATWQALREELIGWEGASEVTQ